MLLGQRSVSDVSGNFASIPGHVANAPLSGLHCILFLFFNNTNARLQTFSTVNPYLRMTVDPGAEAPNFSTLIISP